MAQREVTATKLGLPADAFIHGCMDLGGPWEGEPHRAVWTDPDTGYQCIIRRMSLGYFAGYVSLDNGHPFYGRHYLDIDAIDVHGGLSFSGPFGESPGWKLGFACAEEDDSYPLDSHLRSEKPSTYKDIFYVIRQVNKLAKQLKGVEG